MSLPKTKNGSSNDIEDNEVGQEDVEKSVAREQAKEGSKEEDEIEERP